MRDIIEYEQRLKDDPSAEVPAEVREAMDRLSNAVAPLIARQGRIGDIFGKAIPQVKMPAARFPGVKIPANLIPEVKTPFAALDLKGVDFKLNGPETTTRLTRDLRAAQLEMRPVLSDLGANPAIEMAKHTATIADTVTLLAQHAQAADARAAAAEERADAAEAREVSMVRLTKWAVLVAILAVVISVVFGVLTLAAG